MTADSTHRQEVELPLFIGMTELLPVLLLRTVTLGGYINKYLYPMPVYPKRYICTYRSLGMYCRSQESRFDITQQYAEKIVG